MCVQLPHAQRVRLPSMQRQSLSLPCVPIVTGSNAAKEGCAVPNGCTRLTWDPCACAGPARAGR